MTRKPNPLLIIQRDIIKLADLMIKLSVHEPDFMKKDANRKLKAMYRKYKIRVKKQVYLPLEEKTAVKTLTNLLDL